MTALRSQTDDELNVCLNSFISHCVSSSLNDARACFTRIPKEMRKEYLNVIKDIGWMSVRKKNFSQIYFLLLLKRHSKAALSTEFQGCLFIVIYPFLLRVFQHQTDQHFFSA